jgi:predicted sulfurtransferase/predicted O-methyltransferase YrrM
MLLLFGSARALLRGAVPGRLARHAVSTAAEDLEPVKVTIDQRLRDALRLPGKQRRPRCFVSDRNEETLRDAIEAKVPSLRLQDYSIRHEDGTVVVEPAGPLISTAEDEPEAVTADRYAMVSWYHFFTGAHDAEALVRTLQATWSQMGVLGRAYVAHEGVNAQLCVPDTHVDTYKEHHARLFHKLEEEAPSLNFDGTIEKEGTMPFRALKVRTRDYVVADDGVGADLDLQDPGLDLEPAQWHEQLGGDFGDNNTSTNTILDVRNHYESAVGSFAGATPLNTETFKDTYEALDEALSEKPKTEPVYMFCTGGIRCVKAGAYVKQKLGFSDVRRLKGGVVNYTQQLSETNLEETSRFRGVNYVFNDRIGERVTAPPSVPDEVLDSRAAEALVAVHEPVDEDQQIVHPADAYAVSLSGPEHPLIERCRLDATARYPAAAHMCSGPTQGKLLATLCRLRGASRVLELGTFCGYGTLWLSSASKEVITVDRDERAANIAKEHFRDIPAEWGAVRQVVADRGQYLSTCKDGPFDLVYVDCDKKGYAAVFDVLLDTPGLLSSNACLVFDNTLWKGRVAEGTTGLAPSEEEAILAEAEARGDDPKRALKAARRDRAVAQALHEFNVKLRKDVRVDPLVLPLRDGLTVATLVS